MSTVKVAGAVVGTPATKQMEISVLPVRHLLTWVWLPSLKGDLKRLGDVFHLVDVFHLRKRYRVVIGRELNCSWIVESLRKCRCCLLDFFRGRRSHSCDLVDHGRVLSNVQREQVHNVLDSADLVWSFCRYCGRRCYCCCGWCGCCSC